MYEPLLKSSPTLSCQAHPPLNLKIAQALFLGKPPYILVFHDPSPYNLDFSVNPKNIKVFHPSRHLLKVTKFSVKISQFEFLVMTEQSILVFKPFLLLNILDFSLFFV